MIVCLGDLVSDIAVHTSGAFQVGSDTASTISRHRGGSAANVAAFVARQGHPSRFVGHVGDDLDGRWLAARLSRHGVEVLVTRAGRSGTLVVIVTTDGERHFFTDRGAATELRPFDPAWLDGATRLHLPLYSLFGEPLATTSIDAIAEANRRAIPVSIDTSSTAVITALGTDQVLELIERVRPEVIFANQAEAELLDLGPESPARGAITTVVRHGGIETHLIDVDGNTTTVPVPPVDSIIDTTGAGDAFAAGWLIAAARGMSPTDAAHSAHQLATSVLAFPGADPPESLATESLGPLSSEELT